MNQVTASFSVTGTDESGQPYQLSGTHVYEPTDASAHSITIPDSTDTFLASGQGGGPDAAIRVFVMNDSDVPVILNAQYTGTTNFVATALNPQSFTQVPSTLLDGTGALQALGSVTARSTSGPARVRVVTLYV